MYSNSKGATTDSQVAFRNFDIARTSEYGASLEMYEGRIVMAGRGAFPSDIVDSNFESKPARISPRERLASEDW